jgi:putative nucleotidyltransferase with HDIG domain
MRIERTFLHSKVARRIFFLFVLCALLPICALAILSFFQVAGKLQDQNRAELQQASKARGMTILERLETLDAEIQIIALGLKRNETTPPHDALESHFLRITVFAPNAHPLPLLGSVGGRPSLDSSQTAFLATGKSLLLTHGCTESAQGCVLLAHAVDSNHPETGIIVGEITPDYLWDTDTLPSNLELAVFDGTTPLFGRKRSAPPQLERADNKLDESERWFVWKLGPTQYDAAYWRMFLAPRFHAAPWTIVLSRPHDEIAAPILHFRRTFFLVALLALWTVVLASLVHIRRTLGPLERLQLATKKLAAESFDSRVDVRSGDEFQELAASFNSMAGQLGKQFQALRTIQQIDEAILGSLNRDEILDAVLDRLPHLVPGHSCAIALANDNRFGTGASLSTGGTIENPHKRIFGTKFFPGDIRQIRAEPSHFRVRTGDDIPNFLVPLNLQGGYAVNIFPILNEDKVGAALICAQTGSEPMTDIDIRNTRQIADQLAVALSNVQLISALEQLHWGTLTALARAIDAKSGWTAGHSERVTRLALKIGRAMGLGSDELKIMHRGGLLHDIGKIGTPPAILDKPDKLTPEEMQTMREHVEVGLRILEPIPGLSESLPIVAEHHEWFDGSGYPKGIKGIEINLYARIFAVADCYDAVTSDRPYRRGLPASEASAMIEKRSGTQFDPAVVDAFLRVRLEDREANPELVGEPA